MAAKVPSLQLSDGNSLPIFGLGTWKSTTGEVAEAVKNAIDAGYRHIDGAWAYQNETEVGAAVKAKIDEGVIKREDVFITGKLWNTYHRPDLVIPALKKSLDELGMDYVDLYLMHWPLGYKEDGPAFYPREKGKTPYSEVDYVDTWKAMEEAVGLGLVKSIGVCNFNSEQITRLLDNCTIKPVNVQVEIHPYLNQKKLVQLCQSKGIVVTAYSPLGSPDRPWAKPEDPKLMEDPRLVKIGEKYNKTPAQLVLRWLVQRNIVAIPKSVNKNRLVENISIFDFTLSDEDMELIYTFDCNGRACDLSWVDDHKYFPFAIEF